MVEAEWDAAYRELSAPAALLYRLLACHPTAHFPPQAAIAVLNQGQDAADDALDELETASLLQVRLDGHFHLHDLLRAHARRCARRDGDPAMARAAARRVVRWYRRQAERADLLAAGPRMRLATPLPALPYAPDVPLADETAARRWLERARPALTGCVRLAYEHGEDTDAWALCEPLWTCFVNHGLPADVHPADVHHADVHPAGVHPDDVLDAFHTGVAAAGRAGHPAAEARMRCQLARPLWELGRFDEARGEVRTAERTARALAGTEGVEPRLLPSVVEFRGRLAAAQGDSAAAAAAFECSRQLHQSLDPPNA